MERLQRIFCGIMLILLFVGIVNLAFKVLKVKAGETIYIRADGSIEPPTAPIHRFGDFYVLADNIHGSLVVERNNILISGIGFKIRGEGSGVGIEVFQRENVTLSQVCVSNFSYGVWLYNSHFIKLYSDIIINCESGLRMEYSGHNLVEECVVANNTGTGVSLYYSNNNNLFSNKVLRNSEGMWLYRASGNILKNNVLQDNGANFGCGGYEIQEYINYVDTSNKVNGKPIYYWINRSNERVPSDAGCIMIVNSSNIEIVDLKITNNHAGVQLIFTYDSVIKNVTTLNNYWGIMLFESSYNTIEECNASNNWCGISLDLSIYNNIVKNFVADNKWLSGISAAGGIYLEDCMGYNLLANNYIKNNTYGIGLDDSIDIEVAENNIINSSVWGIMLAGATMECTIHGNNLVGNENGLWLATTHCKNNKIFNNNFLNNNNQVHIQMAIGYNLWDDGYPTGGNYWTDYTGWDENDDGIGDTPYFVTNQNQDNYPLMSPYGKPKLPTYTLTITSTLGGSTAPSMGSYKHSEGQNIPVLAVAEHEYIFDHWELNGTNVGTTNPINIRINANYVLHAVFLLTYTLTISTTTGGTTDPPPGVYKHIVGNTINVKATEHAGYSFIHWIIDGAYESANPINITMNTNHMLLAVFAVKQCTLTLTVTDGGTIVPSPGQYTYPWASNITVTASPDPRYYLDHWELDGVNIGLCNPLHVIMYKNYSLHVVFRELSLGHDVAVKWVTSKTVVGCGCSSSVRVVAQNIGSFAETFNVTLYVNMSVVGSRIITLESGCFETLMFLWNTSTWPKGNYVLSAFAQPVSGETETADNTYIYGNVTVSIIGDISSVLHPNVPDGKVDMADIGAVARLFGIGFPDPAYNLNYDITGLQTGLADGKIDMMDIGTVARHFGEIDF
ncbi:MAG: NosD domain-containing protein [Candidatus Bathyarchaeia archaeon]